MAEKSKTVSPSSRNCRTSRNPPAAPGDYVAVAIAYAEEAIADRKGERFGKWIRLACKRFIADLKRAQKKRAPFYWSPAQANRYCAFIEQLPHVEGVWDRPNIQLAPAQVFFVCNLFGFRLPDGTRRFTTALYAVARKNAKSTLAAAILIACLCLEPEVGPQILSAATTGDQARIVWNVAKRMVEKESDLREAFTLEAFARTIVRYEVGGSFRAINSKASTQDGLNPSALCFDELHAHKTRDLFDVLRSAAGARRSPLFLYTTTEGYESPGPWAETRKFAFNVLEGALEADHFLALYYAVDDGDDDFSESAWAKANPLLGVSVSLKALRDYATEAKAQPGALAEFQIKRLNRAAAAAGAWVNLRKWKRCDGPVDLDALKGAPCWAAFDLASTTDMTAARFLWKLPNGWATWGRYWVPADAVTVRTERGSAPYRAWIQAGHVVETPGEVSDYSVIERDLVELCERFQPAEVAFDPWNATDLANRLQADHSLPLVQFIQGPKSYNPGFQALEAAYVARELAHGGDPVLTWNMANLVPRTDANMNRAPDRKKSADKIDGACCLLMCFARASVAESVGPSFLEL